MYTARLIVSRPALTRKEVVRQGFVGGIGKRNPFIRLDVDAPGGAIQIATIVVAVIAIELTVLYKARRLA